LLSGLPCTAAHEQVFKNAEELLGCPIVGPWAMME
jgi:hypothetical protein